MGGARLVLLGAPGVGKGTQGRRLAERLGVLHVASGAILRRVLAEEPQSDLAQQAQVILSGGFVPDALADALAFAELSRPEAASGFVLDGYPRNVAQAAALDRFLAARGQGIDRVLALEAEEEELVARLSGRLTCLQCSATYQRRTAPPRAEGVCDRCGGTLVQREDDRPAAVANRLAIYRERTAPLVAFYCARGLLRPVDARGAIEAVFEGVCAAVADLI